MKWPWSKKKKGPTFAARRQAEIENLQFTVRSLWQLHQVRPHEMLKLREENGSLRAKLKEAIATQAAQAEQIQRFNKYICQRCHELLPPPEPDESDPSFDAAVAAEEEEDKKR